MSDQLQLQPTGPAQSATPIPQSWCACCGRDEAGMLWLDCWVISATWGVPQKEAHAACSKGAVEYMFLV